MFINVFFLNLVLYGSEFNIMQEGKHYSKENSMYEGLSLNSKYSLSNTFLFSHCRVVILVTHGESASCFKQLQMI